MEQTYQLSEIDSVAKKIIQNAASNIFLFYGTMGAGKTTLIKALVKQLGLPDNAVSPTFALVNEYGDKKKLHHFDFYRIKDESEAFDIGFEEYLSLPGWVCIEWPENIKNLLPERHTALYIHPEGVATRKIMLKNMP